ncbi:hypothetical protein [Levilactobacillus suantsaiihabitans]|uniref:Uncharacterized protein n=1 Tax=Levilactobacillus suantsaiihabitans TaxID=2487722 RepID=A0A4Z0J9C9_9LACO|nr:hypothetical protein [Levilactobacillus suantsaiihabitans]TGD18652.1 hypothetical protein EGT51_07135 [Levilactobacillus suantsaiihabitans]
MADEPLLVYTNVLDYEFDPVKFDHRFRLVLAETQKPEELPAWFAACPVLAIHKLHRTHDDQSGKLTGPYRYLVLLDQLDGRVPNNQFIQSKTLTFKQARSQKIDTDTIVMLMLKAKKQSVLDSQYILRNPDATDKLFLVHSKSKSSYSLAVMEIQLKNHVLQLITRTFKRSQKSYGYVEREGCLKWCGHSQREDKVWTQDHLNGEKNVIDFFSLETQNDFEWTRLGILLGLLTALQGEMVCFRRQPRLHVSEVTNYLTKRKVTALKQVLKQAGSQTICLVVKNRQPHLQALAEYLLMRMSKSVLLRRAGVVTKMSEAAMPGLNIQLVMNRQDSSYQVSCANRVIQHLTFENFGSFDINTKQYQWQLTTDDDIMNDSRFLMTLSQLLTKRDIIQGRLQLSPSELSAVAMRFSYYLFEKRNRKSEPLCVHVTRLTIAATGQLDFEEADFGEVIAPNESNELLQVAYQVWNADNEKNAWLLGAIQNSQGVFAIYQSDLLTIPKVEEISRNLELANPSHTVCREDLVDVVQKLHYQEPKYIQQRKKVLAELKSLNEAELAISQVGSALELSWRNRVMQDFNKQFHKEHGFWLNLPIRQTTYDNYWGGTYGMGLVEFLGEFYYFVGHSTLIQKRQKRAVPLKKIVAMDSERPRADIVKIFGDLESLMQVGFVRLNQYTVLPFPFKYVHEYQELVAHHYHPNENN